MFANMLVAYDGSDLSDKALHYARDWAAQSGSALTALHVVSNPVFVVGEAIVNTPHDYEKHYSEEVLALMDKLNDKIAGITGAKAVLREGQPAAEIIAHAKEIAADVVILGSRGLTGFRELLMGSVSHNIVQLSSIPVLVMK